MVKHHRNKQQCDKCKKWFDGLVLHLKNSSCQEVVTKRTAAIESNDRPINTESVMAIGSKVLDFEFIDGAEVDYSTTTTNTIIDIRIHHYVLEGIEGCILQSEIEEDLLAENFSTINIGQMDDGDNLTIQTEEPFFPLPLVQNLGDSMAEHLANNNEIGGLVTEFGAQKNEAIYAPLSLFQFHRTFTDEEYFMIKLCSICDKANVPHHVVDDVVDLLRDCKQNNISVEPELLSKRIHFLKHLEKCFKSPIPQSIVVGLEGCNDITSMKNMVLISVKLKMV